MSENIPAEWTTTRLAEAIRARTPARIFAGHAGLGYRTTTQLELRHDHAAAVDAVRMELDASKDLGTEFVQQWELFELRTRASSKEEYLLRPDLGRRLNDKSGRNLVQSGSHGSDFQVVIGDGLSAAAVATQVPKLLPLLEQQARARSWSWGRPFVVRHCRVGILNEVGDLLDPRVVVLLIGERPGLATAESLSAYLAFRPRAGHSDAQRNLISNIHERGVPPEDAAGRIAALAEKMIHMGTSGILLKEVLPTANQGAGSLPSPGRS